VCVEIGRFLSADKIGRYIDR